MAAGAGRGMTEWRRAVYDVGRSLDLLGGALWPRNSGFGRWTEPGAQRC